MVNECSKKADLWFLKQMNVSVGTTSADFGIPLMIHAPSQGGGVCVRDTFVSQKWGKSGKLQKEKRRKWGKDFRRKSKIEGKNVFTVSVLIHCRAQ